MSLRYLSPRMVTIRAQFAISSRVLAEAIRRNIVKEIITIVRQVSTTMASGTLGR